MAKGHLAVIEAQAGIAVDPGTGLFFIGDTDTGMYLADPGEVAFTLLGEEAARLTPGGMSVQHSLTVERDLVLYASDSPRIELRLSDATGDGLGSILFEAVDDLESGEIVYFDSNAMPDPEMRFYVAGESILHLWDDTIWVDGNLAAEGGLYVMGNATVDGNAIVGGELALGDWLGSTKASLLFDDALESLFISITDSGGSEDVAQATTSRFDLFVPLSVTGDLSVHKTGGPTLKLSGMAGLQEGRILFEGPGAPETDGEISYEPDTGTLTIRPNAATSSGRVSIGPNSVNVSSNLYVTGNTTVDGNATVGGNLVASGQLRGREAFLVGDAPGTAGNRVMYFPINNLADSHYYLWADAAGAGSDSTRLWLDGPNGGEVVIGPRSSASRFGQVRLRANSVVIDTPPYSGSTGYSVQHTGILPVYFHKFTESGSASTGGATPTWTFDLRAGSFYLLNIHVGGNEGGTSWGCARTYIISGGGDAASQMSMVELVQGNYNGGASRFTGASLLSGPDRIRIDVKGISGTTSYTVRATLVEMRNF